MNELTYHGVHQPNSWDKPYRKLLCAVIRQAVLHAQGLELDADGKPTRIRAGSLKATAIEYLLSMDFECDCMLLDLPDDFVKRVRNLITRDGDWQMPIFEMRRIYEDDKENILKEYKTEKTPQKILAKKYGVTQQRISAILPKKKRKRITVADAETIKEKYAYHNMSLKDIAKEYDYHIGTISLIVNGEYAHLAGAK